MNGRRKKLRNIRVIFLQYIYQNLPRLLSKFDDRNIFEFQFGVLVELFELFEFN